MRPSPIYLSFLDRQSRQPLQGSNMDKGVESLVSFDSHLASFPPVSHPIVSFHWRSPLPFPSMAVVSTLSSRDLFFPSSRLQHNSRPVFHAVDVGFPFLDFTMIRSATRLFCGGREQRHRYKYRVGACIQHKPTDSQISSKTRLRHEPQ